MWLFTIYGFFSVVFKKDKKQWVNIRARVKGDLETLLKHWPVGAGDTPEILTTPDNDYPYRILVDEPTWFVVCAMLAQSVLSVENFKDEVTKRQGHARHDVYLKVWRVMARAYGNGWDLPRK